MPYAEGTTSPVENSRAELERILTKAQADEIYFRSGRDGEAGVVFKKDGVYVRILVVVPPLEQFRKDAAGRDKGPVKTAAARDAEERRLWRCLVLLLKAKLEAVALGLSTFRQEFMADILLPDNTTVGSFMEPQIDRAYRNGSMPKPFAGLLGPPRD